MRILHTSDWHLGKNLSGYSLLEDQQFFLDRLADTIIEQKIELLIIAGDLYDRSVPPAEAVALLDDILWRIVMKLGVPVAAIAGNHDSAQRLSFGGRLLEKNGLYIAGNAGASIQTVRLRDEFGEVALHLLPYFYPQQIRHALGDESIKTYDDAFRALMRSNPPDPACRNVLVAHGMFANLGGGGEAELVTSESEVSVGGLDLIDISAAQGYDYIALGHLHAPQRAGSDFVRYSGSPLKYSVSEHSQHKHLLLIELGKDGCTAITPLPVQPLRELRVIKGRFDELLAAETMQERCRDYICAEILDETPILYAASRLRTVYPNLLELRFPTRTQQGEIPTGERAVKKSVSELFAEFYEHVKGVPMEPEMQQEAEQIAAASISDEQEIASLQGEEAVL